ncbi:sensor domain-containing diguanylate cyclase [Agrobacterium sp. OT33]|uniref:sensor domain-containing diguanylate cyclase n=1 Tax=Agrobacterium sp. OT33 TaxID=2815338 RepID=UPI001A8E3E0C|nr:sensor domain-containing diguanylate cyclase [Agrobacterium sp. OT33]MBO0128453.1 GGDEF domain-containing protein [Agrobacterium sp. OT33]
MREFLERANAENLSYRDLHIILDALPIPLSWATVPDGKIQFVNRAFVTLFGYPEDAFATVEDWIENAYVRHEDRIEARKQWKSLWTAKSSGISEIDSFEIEVRCSYGDIRTVQHRGMLLHEINIAIATFDDISERKIMEEKLHRFAFEDTLTGLANRRMLQKFWNERLASVESSQRISGLLLIDLDGFKAINDRFGHDAGDDVLVAVAKRLRKNVRIEDLVCRLGGDEFVVLIHENASHERIPQICWRIEASLARPIRGGKGSYTVGASIGASLFPQDGQDLMELLKRADEALYRVKREAKGGWQWFATPAASVR